MGRRRNGSKAAYIIYYVAPDTFSSLVSSMPMWFPVAQRIHDVRLFYDRPTRMLQCIPLKFAFASLTRQALRERERERERDRQTDRDRDRETERQRQRQRQTDRDRETERRHKNNTDNKSER